MASNIHIYLSYDAADARTAADLQRQLAVLLQPAKTVFWHNEGIPVEEYRVKASAFLEKAQLFIALISLNYEDHPDVRWEFSRAIEVQKESPAFQIMTVMARSAGMPNALKPFQTALPPGETIEQDGIPRDRQLLRAAQMAVLVLKAAPQQETIDIGAISLPISLEDLKERLLAQTDRINHAPLLALLKRLIKNVQVKRGVLDVEDYFKQLREQTRLSQITLEELQAKAAPIQADLVHLLERLQEEDLYPEWRQVFIRDYYRFAGESREDSAVPPFFVPVDEVIIPETLNLPVGPREQEALEQIGLLSFEQKNDFRRHLLLAKDSLAVKNYTQAYQYCDYVRTKIDPLSAQLYEYLLITYLQKETAARIMRDAVQGNDRQLQYVLLYASRLREYMLEGRCPSTTAQHNLEIAAEGITDAALRLYHSLPNDPLRHTGKHSESVPDNRHVVRIILENTLKVCRLVHPSEELLEAAVIESCGGGKCHWLERVDIIGNRYQFVPVGQFDLLGEIQELIALLEQMESDHANKIVKDKGLLREDLYYSLLAKRQALAAQVAEDHKRRRPYTDVRESMVRFTYACLLGAEVFSDQDQRAHGASFYRLALEYLLPGLLIAPAAEMDASVRWFTLDQDGEVIPVPECGAYHFDALAIVEKIVQDYAGQAGWLKVLPNIKEAVYLEFVADTQALWQEVQVGLSFKDIRRMDSAEARSKLVECLRRWKIIYKAFPERLGQDYLDKSIQELIGDGLMVWLQFDHQGQPVPVSDSLAIGFQATDALRTLLALSTRYTEEDLRSHISANIFHRQIRPQYEAIKRGEESSRALCAKLLFGALSAYKLHQELSYLDFVWQELTEEIKFRWIDITIQGKETVYQPTTGFDPLAVVQELHEAHPQRYRMFALRDQISSRRHQDISSRYFHEISEFRKENRLPDRKVAIEVIRKMKGIYLYFPKAEYLQLPLDELSGRGRIRWHANFLGMFPLQENHYENSYFQFEYKFERFDLKRLLDNQYGEMQRVLREIGELP
ncbi:MAG TPA: hypothetical protein VK168_13955 [Saprospiraceae bacterium]|nr:hypothetical protein [Saprospiraceae bacterium]